MALSFSTENERRIAEFLRRYPDPRAALLPVLHVAQEQFGYLSYEVMELVAQRLGIPPVEVLSTATFYTMYHKRPVGKYHIEVCANVSCYLRGSDSLLAAIEQELGIRAGETTEDGLFTLSTVECLAACGTAPVLQVNGKLYEMMTPEKARDLVRKLKEEEAA